MNIMKTKEGANSLFCLTREEMYVYRNIKLLVPELFFLISAHLVYKIGTIQEPNTLEL